MDVKGTIGYRTVELNVVTTAPPEGIGGGIEGITVNEIDYAEVSIDQKIDKSALRDGVDVGDPFFGGRIINLTGTVHGFSRPRFFDMVQLLRRTFNARLAYLEDPTHKGFLPLAYSVPTDRWTEFPSFHINMKMYATPRSLKMTFRRKASGGADGDALAATWQAQLFCRDPLIYGDTIVVSTLGTNPISGVLANRGDYPGIVDGRWVVNAVAGTITLIVDGVTMVITSPAGAAGRVFEYEGMTKLLYVTTGTSRVTRMDLLNAPIHPVIPAGGAPYSQAVASLALSAGALTYQETYA